MKNPVESYTLCYLVLTCWHSEDLVEVHGVLVIKPGLGPGKSLRLRRHSNELR